MSEELVRWRCPECGAVFERQECWHWDPNPGHQPHCPYCLLEQVRIVPLLRVPADQETGEQGP